MKLVNIGSIAFDDVRTPHGEAKNSLGGSAVYASIASSNFCKTGIVGVVGDDFVDEHFNYLNVREIDVRGIEKVNGKSFHWAGIYNDLNKAETLLTELNVFAEFDPKIPSEYLFAPYLFLGNIDPELQMKVLKEMKNTRIIACDTMNYWILSKKDKLIEVIKNVDILFINEEEIKMLTGRSNIFDAADEALKLGLQYIICKRGEYGSVLFGENLLFFAPIYPVRDVIDPTGAGDSFAGGFMGYLAKEDKVSPEVLKQAMIYGAVTASINVGSFSCNSLLKSDIDSINQRFNVVKKLISL